MAAVLPEKQIIFRLLGSLGEGTTEVLDLDRGRGDSNRHFEVADV